MSLDICLQVEMAIVESFTMSYRNGGHLAVGSYVADATKRETEKERKIVSDP